MSPLGQPNSPTLVFTRETAGQWMDFPFRMADGKDGAPLTGRMEFRVYHVTEATKIDVSLNGQSVDPSVITRRPVDPRAQLPGIRYIIPLSACPPFQGKNILRLKMDAVPDGKPPYMEELEVFVD